jgi:chlorobactene glucosyltransferase
MVEYLTHALIVHLIIFQLVILLVILTNTWHLHHARRHALPPVLPKVSILVPARNEEMNIASCILSLLAQDYPSFELIACDDQSSDCTRKILGQIASSQPTLKVLDGDPLPEGQLGKNWACIQLARQATGDLLFFTDADTIHQPQVLKLLVAALTGEKADLLTGFPRQEMHTWGERLLVPFFSWAFYCFIPLGLAYRLQIPFLSNANGQMMLFRRQAYQVIGGHESVSASMIDDLMLAQHIKKAGLRWRVLHSRDLVSCRMYRGNQAAFDGFTKNLFAAFDFHLLRFSFAFLWLAVMFWEPLIVLSLAAIGWLPQARGLELVNCVGLSLLLWLIPYFELGFPLGLACIYPFTILANLVVAFQSLRLSLTGALTWKDRPLARPRWKWF